MTTKIAIVTIEAVRLGSVRVRMQGMYCDDRIYPPSIALSFSGADLCGLSADFHASTADIRAFAAALIAHADITDAAQAEQVVA